MEDLPELAAEMRRMLGEWRVSVGARRNGTARRNPPVWRGENLQESCVMHRRVSGNLRTGVVYLDNM